MRPPPPGLGLGPSERNGRGLMVHVLLCETHSCGERLPISCQNFERVTDPLYQNLHQHQAMQPQEGLASGWWVGHYGRLTRVARLIIR